jgi:hypothetical protein
LDLDQILTKIFQAEQHYLLRSGEAEGAVQSNAEMGDKINALIID